MIRIYRTLTVLLIIPIATIILLAKALAGTQPIHPALAGFTTGCEAVRQPCWYGIVLGVTTVDEMKDVMLRLGSYREYDSIAFPFAYEATDHKVLFDSFRETTIDRMILSLYNHFSVGDIFSVLGRPDRIVSYHSSDPVNYLYRYEHASLLINLIEIRFEAAKPYLKTFIVLDSYTFSGPYSDDSFEWRGFAPFWKYCQLQQETRACR